MKGYFVTGTDTDVGKTVVSAALVLALDADYWKPVQSGVAAATDTQIVQHFTRLPPERFHPPVYQLRLPLSPHHAAWHDGVAIKLDAFRLPQTPRPLIVEGAGGVLVPLNDQSMMVDLMCQFALPVIVAARSTLGTINHTLLTLEALRKRNIEIAGVVLNGPSNAGNRLAIEQYGAVRVLFELPEIEPLNHETLSAFVRAHPIRLEV